MQTPFLLAATLAAALSMYPLHTAANPDLQTQIQQLKDEFEARLKALEAQPPAPAEPAAAVPAARREPRSSFNPAIALILNGRYAHLSRDPAGYHMQGFIPGGEEGGPGARGFGLGESELTLSASVDPYFHGVLTFALDGEGGAEVEEAYAETVALGAGTTLRMGRFLSGIGYLNSQHAHTWDFIDAPLAYQAFFGGRFKNDGLQARWLAPLDRFLEFGAELGNGHEFPGSERTRNGSGVGAAFVRLGDDWGSHASWQGNAWYQHSSAENRGWDDQDAAGVDVVNRFSGTSDSWGLGLVFKWSPTGNARERDFKLQAEYLQRRESGQLTYDSESASLGSVSGSYASRQSGWYAQAVYRFMPRWRVGGRFDQLDAGTKAIGAVTSGAVTADNFASLDSYRPRRSSAMLDWSLSEFSRLRLQLSEERSAPGAQDRQAFLQYIVSLGAHGAHSY